MKMMRKHPTVVRPLSDEDIHDFVRRTAINHFVYPDLDADHDPFMVGAAMLKGCELDEVEARFLQKYKEAFYRTAIAVDIQWQARHPSRFKKVMDVILCRQMPEVRTLVVLHILLVASAPFNNSFPYSKVVCFSVLFVYIHTVYRFIRGKGKITV
jgi:hypothetical protein